MMGVSLGLREESFYTNTNNANVYVKKEICSILTASILQKVSIPESMRSVPTTMKQRRVLCNGSFSFPFRFHLGVD